MRVSTDSQVYALSGDSLQRVLPSHDTFSGKDRLDSLQGHYSDWGSQKLRPTVGIFRSNDSSAHRLSDFTNWNENRLSKKSKIFDFGCASLETLEHCLEKVEKGTFFVCFGVFKHVYNRFDRKIYLFQPLSKLSVRIHAPRDPQLPKWRPKLAQPIRALGKIKNFRDFFFR